MLVAQSKVGPSLDVTDAGFPTSLGKLLAKGVLEIDRSCDHQIKGIEGGLCNVKSRYVAEALAELGRKLTEETLTSWLLQKRLEQIGFRVESEHPYPGTRKKCDLVLHNDDERKFWIEVKYAWKRWYACNGKTGQSSAFKGYLLGDASHAGAAHDFRKLMKLSRAHAYGIGVLLIGLDSLTAPMDAEVAKLVEQEALAANGWSLAAHESWPDRRNDAFRINCWFWNRR
jgi:hypothetical protein